MDKQKLTANESLELITKMIQNTKQRLDSGDGNIMLIWGYTSLATTVVVYTALLLTGNSHCNWLWSLIPIIGYLLTKRHNMKRQREPMAMTYVDKISAGLWKIAGWLMLPFAAICLIFMLLGYNVWIIMFIYAFIIIGFATAVQGVIFREASMVAGGIASTCAGCVVAGFAICGLPILASWIMPLYALCFIMIMIIPGHVINKKAKRLCQKN